ncbi:DNA excision repair ERCC-2 [Micractinium conductrix]|uniref:DNA excision repair ERCC-2 n=1 Tax=Micractinium conductrix TaxID=554055 RepID=A0A2P6V5W5_9CHLO|nr:DNA excision repair ERCC-2 [Micractinium conductrix]|eukprot:PSC69478.1 DNA excision repair ERCC-2 [Micractinium conductrix]
MYAGKKLRKWYGVEGQVLPRDGGQQGEAEPQPEEEEPAEREYIAVLDADSSPMAEQVVLQLILKRSKIRALVRDVGAAKSGFGPYIEAVQGDSSDAAAVRRLLRGAKAAVCCSKLGALLPAAAAARVPHVVLLTASPAGGGLGSLFAGAEQQALGDASREAALRASGLPHTIVQVGTLAGVPGGGSSLALTAGGAPQGNVAREDAAVALAEAAERDAAAGSLTLQLRAAGQGDPPEDWQAAFADLLAVSG